MSLDDSRATKEGEMKNDADDAEEYQETYMESALGWGGMIIGPDGIGRPMPEDEALIAAIPDWVGIPEHLNDAVQIYIQVLGRPEQSVRLAAVIAIGEVARRYGRLPHRTNARGAVMRALTDPSPEVRTAAAATLGLIDQHSA
jgi:hypothetical protein